MKMKNNNNNKEKANQRLEHHGVTSRLLSKLVVAVAAICAITLGSVRTASAAASSRPTALTQSGVVIGVTKNGVNEFLGIPYAAPPVGDRRWGRRSPMGSSREVRSKQLNSVVSAPRLEGAARIACS